MFSGRNSGTFAKVVFKCPLKVNDLTAVFGYLFQNEQESVPYVFPVPFHQMLGESAHLVKTADGQAGLTDYMMAKYGLERNEVMARRAAGRFLSRPFNIHRRTF